MSNSKDALFSLYGDGHLNAIRTRECVAMPGERDQRICSPPSIATRLRRLWEDGPAYDPSHCAGSVVGARTYTETRGLLDVWVDQTYYNPPYGMSLYDPENEMEAYCRELLIKKARTFAKEWNTLDTDGRWERFPAGVPDEFQEFLGNPTLDATLTPPKLRPEDVVYKAGLEDWLLMHIHSADQAIPRNEIIGLVPNRTHRPWLRRWRAQCDALVELDPLAFLVENRETGQWEEAPSAYPAPLVLGYTGPRGSIFCEAFSDMGDPV